MNVAVEPTDTDCATGAVVMAGATSTVNVAGVVVTLPAALVNTASYSLPLSDAGTLLTVNVPEVAPAIVAKLPPLVETFQMTAGVGLPLAVAEKLAVWPASTVSAPG
jgi:hypothetical protein